MPEVEVYSRPVCPFCRSAKELLRRKRVEFREINVDGEPQRRAEMIARANGRTTVPQVFVGDTHVGGCDDLYALEEAGELDRLLNP
jgi:glutaredoxin 3